jgi:S-formylglutathione hydrolase FrmB
MMMLYSFGYKLEDTLCDYGIPFSSYFPEGAHQWSVWKKIIEDFVNRVLWK